MPGPITGVEGRSHLRLVGKDERPPTVDPSDEPSDATPEEERCLALFIDALADPQATAAPLLPYARAIDTCVWFIINNMRIHDDERMDQMMKSTMHRHLRDFFYGGFTLGWLTRGGTDADVSAPVEDPTG